MILSTLLIALIVSPRALSESPVSKRRWQGVPPDKLPSTEARPFATALELRVMDTFVHPGAVILEYGSGDSTLYFASAGRSSRIVSVEHDAAWCAHTQAELDRAGLESPRVQLLCRPPDIPRDSACSGCQKSFYNQFRSCVPSDTPAPRIHASGPRARCGELTRRTRGQIH